MKSTKSTLNEAENGNKSKPLLQDVLDFEIEEVFNRTMLIREKPPKQIGIGAFPGNYETKHWECLKVTRKKDNLLLFKELTITDKGSILYFKFRFIDGVKKCLIGTVLGEYDINEVVVKNIL
jgi:hypothetical protein